MAYDEDLANRIRELLADEAGISEKGMFGGLAYLLHGKIAVAISSRGGLMVRVGPEVTEDALARPHTRIANMGGRVMRGWILVDPEGLKSKRQLAPWVRRGSDFARTLTSRS